MVNVQPGQELQPNQGLLTQEEFKNLNNKEKHALIDAKMGNRIKLSYNQALTECRRCINSQEKLSRAFQNFLDMKEDDFGALPEKEVLLGAFIDKFKERIFFVFRDNLQISHYIYDKPSQQFINYAADNGPAKDMMQPDLSHIKFVSFGYSDNKNFESIWRSSYLYQTIKNENTLNRNFTHNQEYVSDNHYKTISKLFKPIQSIDDFNEINGFYVGFVSRSNPAHSTIDPDDLINHQGKFTKNARNV